MVKVSIDVDAAREVAQGLQDLYDDAMTQWTTVGNACGRAMISTSSLSTLSDALILLQNSGDDLTTRVDLALLYNTGDHGNVPTGGVLAYELSGTSDSMDAVRKQLGVELAQGINDISPYGEYLNREDVENFDYYASLVAKYQDEPLVMEGMFEELGPEGTVRVPAMLKDFLESYERGLLGKGDEDIRWDDDTSMSEHIQQMQQTFIEAMSHGLGNYTTSAGYDADFAAGIVEATKSRTGEGWGLSHLLRYGDFGSPFLEDLGTGLYDIEKDATGPVWGNQMDGDVALWHLGTEDYEGAYDPFVGLFGAMGRNPEAGANFFNPDGGGDTAKERSKYFLQDRTWQADDFNALGEALDAAATTWHTTSATPEQQAQAAWIASASVYYLGNRDAGRNDKALGDAGKDSLGHIVATYINDVDRVAWGAQGGLGTYSSNESDPWDVGLPMGADFDYEALQNYLSEVLTDENVATNMGEATAAWNAHRLNVAAAAWDGTDRDDADQLRAALLRGARLQGFVLSTMGAGLETEAKAQDEKVKAYIGAANDVVGLIPTGGTFTSFVANQVISQGKDWAEEKWASSAGSVAGENHQVQQVAISDLQIAAAVALAEHGHLPPESTTNEPGQTYPWFDGDTFDPDALTTPEARDHFLDWIGSGDGGFMTELAPDIDTEFAAGVDRGGQ